MLALYVRFEGKENCLLTGDCGIACWHDLCFNTRAKATAKLNVLAKREKAFLSGLLSPLAWRQGSPMPSGLQVVIDVD